MPNRLAEDAYIGLWRVEEGLELGLTLRLELELAFKLEFEIELNDVVEDDERNVLEILVLLLELLTLLL